MGSQEEEGSGFLLQALNQKQPRNVPEVDYCRIPPLIPSLLHRHCLTCPVCRTPTPAQGRHTVPGISTWKRWVVGAVVRPEFKYRCWLCCVTLGTYINSLCFPPPLQSGDETLSRGSGVQEKNMHTERVPLASASPANHAPLRSQLEFCGREYLASVRKRDA